MCLGWDGCAWGGDGCGCGVDVGVPGVEMGVGHGCGAGVGHGWERAMHACRGIIAVLTYKNMNTYNSITLS